MSPKRLQEWQKRLLRLSAKALDRGDEAEALRLWRAAKLRPGWYDSDTAANPAAPTLTETIRWLPTL